MRITLFPIVTVAVLSACAASSPMTEAEIKQEIAAANTCNTADDCVDVGAKCPFDCYIYVHKSEAPRIKSLVDGFESTCQYSCLASNGVQCIEHTCQVIHEPVPPPSEEEAKGNVGAACTTDSECVTPMDYLIRSMCPFTSKCIEGSCAVVCPQVKNTTNPQTGLSEPETCSTDADCDCKAYAASDKQNCSCVSGACMAVVKK